MSKIKLPKQIAGVKVPKVVRKGPFGEFINSSAGQLMLAEMLTVAAAAFVVKRTDLRPVSGKVRDKVIASQEDVEEMSGRLARAFHAGLAAFREELRVDPEVVDTLRAEAVADDERPKKKSRKGELTGNTH